MWLSLPEMDNRLLLGQSIQSNRRFITKQKCVNVMNLFIEIKYIYPKDKVCILFWFFTFFCGATAIACYLKFTHFY